MDTPLGSLPSIDRLHKPTVSATASATANGNLLAPGQT
jgi:hypothetical protein